MERNGLDWLKNYACRFESLTENLGIGAAQNWGFAAVTRQESIRPLLVTATCYFSITTAFKASMVNLLLAADLNMRAQGVRVGAVGPAIVDNRTGTTGRFVSSSNLFVKRIPCQPDVLNWTSISSYRPVRSSVSTRSKKLAEWTKRWSITSMQVVLACQGGGIRPLWRVQRAFDSLVG